MVTMLKNCWPKVLGSVLFNFTLVNIRQVWTPPKAVSPVGSKRSSYDDPDSRKNDLLSVVVLCSCARLTQIVGSNGRDSIAIHAKPT